MKFFRSVWAGPRFVGRAAGGFGLVTIVTALTTIGSAIFARDASTRREQILTAYADDLTHAYQAQLAAERMVAVGRGYLLAPDPAALDRFHATEAQLDGALGALDHPGSSGRERELLTQTRRSALRYRTMFDDLIESHGSAIGERGSLFRDRLLPAREDLGGWLEELVDHKKGLQDAARHAARRMDARMVAFIGALGAAGVFFSILLASWFTRHLGHIYGREQEAAARATRESAAREDLLGIVAHDLRNSVGAILLKSALISKGVEDSRIRRQAESIESLATHMEAFIQTVLDAASIEAGRLSVSWKRCMVADVLAATIETLGALAAQKSVTIEQEVGRRDLSFWGDPERIAQVLSNLVGNALKFTPEGGRITIRAVESGFHTRIEVRDTGPGIASQHLPRVFDRFWKADAEGRKGTGLGLYIAKGIVEGHRGRIWVESRVGAGSAFIFEIPIVPTTGAEPESEGAPLDDRRKKADPTERGYELGEHPHS